jgi:hypothetical protein
LPRRRQESEVPLRVYAPAKGAHGCQVVLPDERAEVCTFASSFAWRRSGAGNCGGDDDGRLHRVSPVGPGNLDAGEPSSSRRRRVIDPPRESGAGASRVGSG